MKKIYIHNAIMEESEIDGFEGEAIILDPGEAVCREVVCPRCEGEKGDPVLTGWTCWMCNGTGKVYVRVEEK
jgi:hypothetical protein